MTLAKVTPLAVITDAADIGKIVRKLRTEQHATQMDLAAIARTGERFIVDLERGKPTLRIDKVLAVLEELGLRLAIVER